MYAKLVGWSIDFWFCSFNGIFWQSASIEESAQQLRTRWEQVIWLSEACIRCSVESVWESLDGSFLFKSSPEHRIQMPILLGHEKYIQGLCCCSVYLAWTARSSSTTGCKLAESNTVWTGGTRLWIGYLWAKINLSFSPLFLLPPLPSTYTAHSLLLSHRVNSSLPPLCSSPAFAPLLPPPSEGVITCKLYSSVSFISGIRRKKRELWKWISDGELNSLMLLLKFD